jgi:cytosine/adenosine deaminase-related metal-dependent hydrolase
MDKDLGTIEAGKLADFIVMDKNPLDEIRNARQIRYVIKNGVIYEGETMNEVWPESKPCPKFTFQALGGEMIGKP